MKDDQPMTATNDNDLPGRPGIALWVLIALFVGGVISLVYGWSNEGLQPDIGLLIASYLFLLGVSQAGVVFCAMTRLVHAQWAKPYYRLAEFSTLAFFPFAIVGFLLIYAYAQDDLFYWLSPGPDEHLSSWLNIDWLLIRNLFALMLFYSLSAYSAVKALKPDLAGATAQDTNHREIAGELYMLSPVVLGAFILCNTFIAWDFGMMLIPHWHSTVFPILFWFGNVFAGTAALIIFPALLGRRGDLSSPFGPEQVKGLGMMVTGFTLMWLYFFWAQFFVTWFGNLSNETDPLWRQMYGHYGPYFWVMMAGCFFIPFVAFIFAFVKRSTLAMCLIALGINLGMWLYKYLTVVPVLSSDHQPFTSWLDISVAIGFVAGFVALVVLLATRFPMYSRWEMALKPIPRR
jgi:formate-dependent nitrite reductase membrane component NrfD